MKLSNIKNFGFIFIIILLVSALIGLLIFFLRKKENYTHNKSIISTFNTSLPLKSNIIEKYGPSNLNMFSILNGYIGRGIDLRECTNLAVPDTKTALADGIKKNFIIPENLGLSTLLTNTEILKINRVYSKDCSFTSVKDYVYSKSVDTSTSATYSGKFVSAKATLKTEFKKEITENTKIQLLTYEYEYKFAKITLKNNRDLVKPDFIKDFEENFLVVKQNEVDNPDNYDFLNMPTPNKISSWKKYDAFFTKYGTHIIKGATIGSKVNINFSSTDSTKTSTESLKVKACVEAASAGAIPLPPYVEKAPKQDFICHGWTSAESTKNNSEGAPRKICTDGDNIYNDKYGKCDNNCYSQLCYQWTADEDKKYDNGDPVTSCNNDNRIWIASGSKDLLPGTSQDCPRNCYYRKPSQIPKTSPPPPSSTPPAVLPSNVCHKWNDEEEDVHEEKGSSYACGLNPNNIFDTKIDKNCKTNCYEQICHEWEDSERADVDINGAESVCNTKIKNGKYQKNRYPIDGTVCKSKCYIQNTPPPVNEKFALSKELFGDVVTTPATNKSPDLNPCTGDKCVKICAGVSNEQKNSSSNTTMQTYIKIYAGGNVGDLSGVKTPSQLLTNGNLMDWLSDTGENEPAITNCEYVPIWDFILKFYGLDCVLIKKSNSSSDQSNSNTTHQIKKCNLIKFLNNLKLRYEMKDSDFYTSIGYYEIPRTNMYFIQNLGKPVNYAVGSVGGSTPSLTCLTSNINFSYPNESTFFIFDKYDTQDSDKTLNVIKKGFPYKTHLIMYPYEGHNMFAFHQISTLGNDPYNTPLDDYPSKFKIDKLGRISYGNNFDSYVRVDGLGGYYKVYGSNVDDKYDNKYRWCLTKYYKTQDPGWNSWYDSLLQYPTPNNQM